MRTHYRILWLGVVWLVLGGLLALGLHVRLSGVSRSAAEFTERQLPLMLAFESLRSQILQAESTCHEIAAIGVGDHSLPARVAQLNHQLWNVEAALRTLEASIPDPRLKAALRPGIDAAASWHDSARNFASNIADGEGSALRARDLAPVVDRFVTAQEQLGEFMEKNLRPSLLARAETSRALVAAILNESLTLIALAAIAGCALTVFMARTVHVQQCNAARAQERQAFDARIADAMNMAQDEPEAMRLVEDILNDIHPDLPASVLIADSSRAHLHEVASTHATNGCSPLCDVRAPAQCPAVRRGFEMTFPTSRSFDACPHLRHREGGPASATCVPITITGQHVGVLHAATPEGRPLSSEQITRLTVIAAKTGERIGVIRAFSQSEDQATKDALTGLLNRRSAESMVQQLQRSDTPFCIVYADIDHFKRLNDTHGHETGDRVLRMFSRIVTDALRPTDVVARWGGEEFVMLLPNANMERAQPIIERLRQAIQAGTGTGSCPAVTASFGLAECDPKDDFAARLDEADTALLQAKQEGRNRVNLARLPGLAATA